MVELYGTTLAVRIFLSAALIVSLALQALRVFLLIAHQEHRVHWSVFAFEFAVLIYMVVAVMLVSMTLLQRNFPSAYLLELRYVAVLPIALGIWVAAASRIAEPLLCSFLLIPTLPVWSFPFLAQVFFAGGTYLSLRSAVKLDQEWLKVKDSVSRLSIREAVDLYPGGILYASDKGRILIINPAMSKLLNSLGINSRADVPALWDDLQNRQDDFSVSVKALGEQLLIRLRNAGSWLISRQSVVLDKKQYMQLLAVDVTDEDMLNVQIEESNLALEQTGREILDAIGTIDELEKQREILRMKARIHDSLGHRLSILSRLLDSGQDIITTIRQLKPMLTDLSEAIRDSADACPDHVLTSLVNSFALIGTVIHQKNSLPDDREVALAFAEVVREGSTNAVRHADARNVFVSFEEQKDAFTLILRNDGSLPMGDIEEGGGITGMRQRVGELGGTLAITVWPHFSIVARVPRKQRGEKDDTSTDSGGSGNNEGLTRQPDRRATRHAGDRDHR
jgi:signal transduction histidine kinase